MPCHYQPTGLGMESPGFVPVFAKSEGPGRTQVQCAPAVTGPVRLLADGPRMLVILPRDTLPEVVRALTAVPATWPVHAQ